MTTKAIVLAAGRGFRMRAAGPDDPPLASDQEAAARLGRKALIPFHGHPFLSHLLHELGEGGIRDVCLVVGPEPDPVRAYFSGLRPERLRIQFGVQPVPTGSAHAVAAAIPFAGSDPVLVVNGDNLYPSAVADAVRRLPGNGLAGFRASALVAEGNILPDRIPAFALVGAGADGCLEALVEKPDPTTAARFGPDPLVSMTCWRFGPEVLDACRRVGPSPRGEHEIPDAVLLSRSESGGCFQVLPVEAGVLDLGRRSDVASVEARLAGREPRL